MGGAGAKDRAGADEPPAKEQMHVKLQNCTEAGGFTVKGADGRELGEADMVSATGESMEGRVLIARKKRGVEREVVAKGLATCARWLAGEQLRFQGCSEAARQGRA